MSEHTYRCCKCNQQPEFVFSYGSIHLMCGCRPEQQTTGGTMYHDQGFAGLSQERPTKIGAYVEMLAALKACEEYWRDPETSCAVDLHDRVTTAIFNAERV